MKRRKTQEQKNKEVHKKQSSKTERRFSKRGRSEKQEIQEFNTQGRCETQFKIS